MTSKRNFLLDTSVLLHDPQAFFQFDEHDIYLSLAVIDDLDEIKTRRESVGWYAREVFRILDQFPITEMTTSEGCQINEKGGRLYIYNPEMAVHGSEMPTIKRLYSDNALIEACLNLNREQPETETTLVTKDTGLRVRAMSYGCHAENYQADLLHDTDYTGIRIIQVEDYKLGQSLWSNDTFTLDILPENIQEELKDVAPNEFVIFENGPSKCSTIYKNKTFKVLKDKKDKKTYMGITPKNLEQQFAMEVLADSNVSLVTLSGPAGTGKAQSLTSNILTPNGFKMMGEMCVGDEVISGDGKPAVVTGVFPQGLKEIYKVEFSDGVFTECCAEHLWTVQDEYDRTSGKTKTLSLHEIEQKILGHDGRKNYSIPIVESHFSESTLSIHPYLLGALIGDGGLSCSLPYFSTRDFEIIEKIKPLLPKDVSCVKIDKNECDYRLTTGNKNGINLLTLTLRELNLMGRKSNSKFIPFQYLHSSVEQRTSLLQGLMDTDGTCDKRGTHISYSTVSEQLSNDICWLVRSLGGTAKVNKKTKQYTYLSEKKIGQLCYDITINIPENIKPFSLKRKLDLYIPKTKYKPCRYITNIEFVGIKQAQCIMVDHPTHLYVTDDFIVTHNTLLSLAVGLQKIHDGEFDRIIVIKPIVPVGGKDLGALPGTKFEKIAAWLGPIRDNIEQLVTEGNDKRVSAQGSFEDLIESGVVEAEAMTYIQGRSIPHSLIIVDEVENLTPRETRMVIERCGKGSKVILLGDLSQVENPFLDAHSCGLAHAINGSRYQDCCATVRLKQVERSALAAVASEIFKRTGN